MTKCKAILIGATVGCVNCGNCERDLIDFDYDNELEIGYDNEMD